MPVSVYICGNMRGNSCSVFHVISERRLSLKLEYQSYGNALTSDRLIQLLAVTINKQTTDFTKAEKTVVLDEPDIKIKVSMNVFEKEI